MERGVTNEYAPTSYEGLVEAVGSLACDPDRECFQPYEYQDRHHLVYGKDLSEAERLIKSHPDFIINACRCAHMIIHKNWDRSEPVSDEFVIGYLTASPVNLTPRKRKTLNNLRRGGK